MENKKIIVIDETIREGMQYRGIVFSQAQREKIIGFQEQLKIDICQAGYPTAHDSEASAVKHLVNIASKKNYNVKIAAMGRAMIQDAKVMLQTGINDFHFHLYIPRNASKEKLYLIFKKQAQLIAHVREEVPDPVISIAMLDIGKTPAKLLEECITFLSGQLGVDILSLPDTSGVMAPNEIDKKINQFLALAKKSMVSIHCHNDMGMANANSYMGIMAGANILEASALGIGERNGIADLFCTVKMLKDHGFEINVDTDNTALFEKYYAYVSDIVKVQTKDSLLTYNTPFFGDAVHIHVAGTHAAASFGLDLNEKFFLNVLCGRQLVQKYLNQLQIPYEERLLEPITAEIKSQSAGLNRSLTKNEILAIVREF